MGTVLTFTLDSGAPAGATIQPASGLFTWTPSEAQGPGSYPVTIRVSDGLASDFETITITVAEVNLAPVASDDVYTTKQDTALSVPVGTGVLANDSDVDGNAITAVLINLPEKGFLSSQLGRIVHVYPGGGLCRGGHFHLSCLRWEVVQ